MAVLSTNQAANASWADVGRRVTAALAWLLFAVGWTVAKTLRMTVTAIAAVLFAVGWLSSAAAWPALCWCGRAVRLGWEQGRAPIGGPRGPA
jgi:hypothetical protein